MSTLPNLVRPQDGPELGSLLDADALGQWAWVLAYTAFLSSISVLRYHLWIANGLDLGQYEQGLWLIWHHGLMALSTYTGLPILATSGSYVLILLAPLYAIGGVGILLVLQSFALGSGYFFVRRIALTLGSDLRTAHLLGLVYLISPTVLGVNLFDFHPQVLGIPVLLALVWAAMQDKWAAFSILSILAFLIDVSTALLLTGIGISLLLRRRFVPGAFTIVLSLVLGYLDAVVLLPALGHGALPAWSNFYAQLGSTPNAGVVALFLHPGLFVDWVRRLRSWEYSVWLLGTPAAIMIAAKRPGFSPWWIPALLLMEANLLSNQIIRTSPFNEFSVLAIPFVFGGLCDVLTIRPLPRMRASAVFVVPLALLLLFGWQQRRTYWQSIPFNATALQTVTSVIPPGAPLVAQNFDVAHLADRSQEWLPDAAVSRTLLPGTFLLLDPGVPDSTTAPSTLAAIQAAMGRPGQAREVFSQNGVEVYELLRPMQPLTGGRSI